MVERRGELGKGGGRVVERRGVPSSRRQSPTRTRLASQPHRTTPHRAKAKGAHEASVQLR